jgi:hypothetical protein
MDNSTPDNDLLVRYLDGELSDAEKIPVENVLGEDPAWQEAFEKLQATRAAIRYYGAQQQVAALHKDLVNPQKGSALAPVRRFGRYTLAVAASIALVIVCYLGFTFYKLSSKRVFESQFISYVPTQMRDSGGNRLTSMEEAYLARNYHAVVRMKPARPKRENEMFLKGVSWLEIRNYEKAVEELRSLHISNSTASVKVLPDETDYYLALAYIGNKDYDLALDVLRKIREDRQHTYHDRVSARLIRDLKLLKWR